MVDATTPMMVDLDGDGTAETVVIDYDKPWFEIGLFTQVSAKSSLDTAAVPTLT